MVSCGKDLAPSANSLVKAEIIGGKEVSTANLYSRHTVGLFNHKSKMICTGVIIEDDLILTAAHCTVKAVPKKMEIIFGNRLLAGNEDSVRMKARAIYTNPKYDPKTFENDLALIRLERKIPSDFRAVDLEDSRQIILQKNQKVTSIGYGVNKVGSLFSGKGVLRIKELSIEGYYADERFLVIDQKNGAGVCFGDSGGPSFILVNGKPVVVGIVSYVNSHNDEEKAKCDVQSFLSNPNFYYSWIQETKLKI